MSARRWIGRAKHYAKYGLRSLSASYPGGGPIAASHWGLEAVADRGLCLNGLALHALLQQWGSPLYVVDVAALRRNAALFMPAASGHASSWQVFYSYKTNPV